MLPKSRKRKYKTLLWQWLPPGGYHGMGKQGRSADRPKITENNSTNADRGADGLLEEIVSSRNLNRAYKRVKKNKGAGGVDGMKVDGLLQYLKHMYLRAGVVECGRFMDTEVGVPQGGPLSPLLANIMLNELNHELEHRGHQFVRYADDMVIFCGSKANAKETLNISSRTSKENCF